MKTQSSTAVLAFFSLIATLPASGATRYTIQFTASSGSPTATGSFNYDPTIMNSFSSFIVTWNGIAFDLTAQANAGGITDFGISPTPACLGNHLGPSATFKMLIACSGTQWVAADVTSIGPTYFQIGLPGPSGVLNPLFEMGDDFVWIALSGQVNSGGSALTSGAAGTLTIQPTPPEPVYISDNQNNRIRAVNISGVISTTAGNGTGGFSGDSGLAVNAELHIPFGLALDGSGKIYVADTLNNRIREISSGIVATIAGTGAPGSGGDGGAAVNAQLNHPSGVAADGSGNLYIADEYNNRIRKIDVTGKISTVAGNGTVGGGGDGGSATRAQLYYPTGVAVDKFGNFYIADSSNQRIRKVTGGTITTVAGNGNVGYNCTNGTATSLGLHTPTGVAVDGSGNLFIADYGNQCVRKVDSLGNITTVAGTGLPSYGGDGGPAMLAALNYPTGVAVDSSGNLYIADYVNHRVRLVDTSGIITTIAGDGTAGFSGDGGLGDSATLYGPTGVAVAAPPVAP
jgi:sugar lactone lactonase YvrE